MPRGARLDAPKTLHHVIVIWNWSFRFYATAAEQGNLAIGEVKAVGFAVSPAAAVAEGDYAFYLRVAAANHPTTDINL